MFIPVVTNLKKNSTSSHPDIAFLLAQPDCFLEIGRQIDSITFHPVFRTEVAPKTRHPWYEGVFIRDIDACAVVIVVVVVVVVVVIDVGLIPAVTNPHSYVAIDSIVAF